MDLVLFGLLNSLSGKSAVADGIIVFLAEHLAYLTLALAVIFILRVPGVKSRILVLLFASLSAILSKGIIGDTIWFLYGRPRPFLALKDIDPLLYVNNPSFPSGHASLFFALAAVTIIINKRWGIAFTVLAVIISLARVAAGIHWPSDILGGAIVGAASSFIIWTLLKNLMPFPPKHGPSTQTQGTLERPS